MSWKVLVAPSCFKEGLGADEVAAAIRRGILRAAGESHVTVLPLTDGGEGFTRTLARATGGSLYPVRVSGPCGETVEASFAMLGGQAAPTAALEIASAAGLRLIPRAARSPLAGTSRGVGELLRAALDHGARHLVVGTGDSGTNDGGVGMARALGVRFLDERGAELDDSVASLERLASIDLAGRDPRISEVSIEVACNYHGLLTGPGSTSRVYGPQKGATPEMVERLDAAMERLAERIERDLGTSVRRMPGGGAAGGLGAGLFAFLGARLLWRYDVVFRYIDIDAYLDDCDLVVTAEGGLDFRTRLGKLPAELGRRAGSRGIPVIAIVGQIGEGAREILGEGVTAYFSILQGPCSLEAAMAEADRLVEEAAESMMRLLATGARIDVQAERP